MDVQHASRGHEKRTHANFNSAHSYTESMVDRMRQSVLPRHCAVCILWHENHIQWRTVSDSSWSEEVAAMRACKLRIQHNNTAEQTVLRAPEMGS